MLMRYSGGWASTPRRSLWRAATAVASARPRYDAGVAATSASSSCSPCSTVPQVQAMPCRLAAPAVAGRRAVAQRSRSLLRGIGSLGPGSSADEADLSNSPESAPAADGLLAPGLYVVGTPIGNLEDMSPRALRVLRCADVVLAEDTRHTGQLCHRLGVSARLLSCHEHNEQRRAQEARRRAALRRRRALPPPGSCHRLPCVPARLWRQLTHRNTPLCTARGCPHTLVVQLLARAQVSQLLAQGGVVALVSDAGMPGVSDPGERVVAAAVQAGCSVVPVPGPAAFLAALVASGLPTREFHFVGFTPHKAVARRTRLQALAGVPGTLVMYVSPHALVDVLADAAHVLGEQRRAVLARELTKLHEEFLRGTLHELVQVYAQRKPKGEFVLLVDGADDSACVADRDEWSARLQALLRDGVPASAAVRQVVAETGVPRKQVYAEALELQKGTVDVSRS